MNCIPQNSAQKRYLARFATSMAFYVLCMFIAKRTIIHGQPAGALLYAVAILPALPIIASLVIVGIYLAEETDEFERTMMVQSMLWSMGGLLALTSVWGFLEIFARIPSFQVFWAFPIFWILIALTTPVIRLRYR